MPIILLQTLYIDVFGKGLDFAIRQMVDVVNGNNTFNGGMQKFENIRGEVNNISSREKKLTIRAVSYAEPISRYLILVGNNESEINYNVIGESMINSGFNKGVTLDNGLITNAIYIAITRSTTPSFPIEIVLKSDNVPIIFNGILREVSQNAWSSFPLISV